MKKKELKSSKSLEKKSNQSKDRFLLKNGDSYFIVNKFVVDSFSFQEILIIAENTYLALQKQIYSDAIHGDHFVEGMNVTESLQRGLDALYSRHPILRDYIKDQLTFKSLKQNLA